ncbi:MAG: HEPN domain-containing protein [Anaerolineae bacterium]|nr:HEPN domain-containing protein [Anaerolineae bacterium]
MTAPEKNPISDHLRQRAQEWFRRADHLLALVERAPFEISDPPTNIVAALANMVVEYVLKGYLMLYKQKIPTNHDLGVIFNLCLAVFKDADFESIRPFVEEMVRYRVEFDYPGVIQESISVEEALEAIRKARLVRDFILTKIRPS